MTARRPELDEFCERLRGPLVGAISLMVRDRYVADELANEALLRAIERWDRVRAMANPDAWTYAVAFNLARSRFRRMAAERRAHRRLHRVPDAYEPAEASASVAVHDALASLPERQRQAVVCRYFLDLSVAQVGEVMGCATGTAKAHLRDAMAQLRQLGLGPGGDEPDA